MRNATILAELQAKIADLERRMAWNEAKTEGTSYQRYSPWDLSALYVAACRIDTPSESTIELWRCVILHLDCAQLLELARRVRDPFPWKPFVVMLEAYRVQGFDTADPLDFVFELAQELLRVQGLGLLRPEDVMGYPTRSQEAFSTIRSRGENAAENQG